MKTLNEFDILFRNLFDRESYFAPFRETRSPHPVDIYETAEGLFFEVVCTGLTKDDVEIDIEHDILRIAYNRKVDEQLDRTYQVRGIARRSFDLAYKVTSRFNLTNAQATMENGLLVIKVPAIIDAVSKKLFIA